MVQTKTTTTRQRFDIQGSFQLLP